MKYLLPLCLLLLGFSATAQKQFVVDPEAEPREISGNFSSIKISSGINLFLSKADAEVVAVSGADAEIKSRIKTEVRNGELHIFYSGDRIHYGKNLRMSVYVGYKNLEQLHASGGSNIVVAGVMELRVLNVHMTGASDFRGEIKVNELNVKLSGASDMNLTGSAGNVNIESSGASDLKAYGLTAENCNVNVSGASDVNITVNKEISANASGASDVYFKGPAEIKIKEFNGASTIARVN